MAMRRTGQPWMSAEAFGQSLPRGVGINVLVTDMSASVNFMRDVLAARIIYADEDFAALEIVGSVLMLHADHTYRDTPMSGVVSGVEARGAGIEIRVYGLDPDAVERAAAAAGHIVLSGSLDKPHGLRECHVVGPDGYVFVPSVHRRG